MTASLQPTSFRKPNCSRPGCHASRARLSKTRPNQETIELRSLIPRRLLASCLGLPGLRMARTRAMSQSTGYTPNLSMRVKTKHLIELRFGRPAMTAEGMMSWPTALPVCTRHLQASVSSRVTGLSHPMCKEVFRKCSHHNSAGADRRSVHTSSTISP